MLGRPTSRRLVGVLAQLACVALLATAGCSSRQDVRAVWTMPGATPPGQAQARNAPGYAWVYTSGQSGGADRVEQPGELPEVGRAPNDALWGGDEAQARARARRQDRLILIDFYADWCEPCMHMAAETFTDPQLRLLLKERFVTLQINITEESARTREQLERYGVDQLPTLLLVAPDGQEIDRIDRFVSAAELLERLQVLSAQRQPAPETHAEPDALPALAPTASAVPAPKPAAQPGDEAPGARAPWCAPELETLPGDVCFFAAEARPGKPLPERRTLVVFLHGWVQDGLAWQHAQQRAIVRGARRHGFSVITPRGRAGASARAGSQTVSWPTSPKAQARYEDVLLGEWRAAQAMIEQRQGAPFDEVFVMGFSNGAYYASSLAMRARLPVDGYAMFAGGSAYAPRAPKPKRAPIFLGICSRDSTAKRARALKKQLGRTRWPHRAESRKVGHTMADAHLAHAIAYLRKQAVERSAPIEKKPPR